MLLLGLLVLLPGLPPVREALLTRVAAALDSAGVELTYGSSAGNAWRGLTLTDVEVRSFGSTLNLGELGLAYHLPSLLGGELPLNATARAVSGDIDLTSLETALQDDAGASGSPAAFPRLVLGEVVLEDVDVTVANSPFTLPSGTISGVKLETEPGALLLAAKLTTSEGALEAAGRLDLHSFDFAGNVTHLDVAVARQWWLGATSGTATGTVNVRKGQVSAALQIEDAAIEETGIVVTGINGTARLDYPLITADLAGTGFGGPVRAQGTVDVLALNYDIDAVVEPALEEVADWLVTLYDLPLPQAVLPPEGPVRGSARVTGNVSGWITPRVRASVEGHGALLGQAMTALSGSADIQIGGNYRANANAQLEGGALHATVAPSSSGHRLQLSANGMVLDHLQLTSAISGAQLRSIEGSLDYGAPGKPASGNARAAFVGAVFEQATELELDARLDGDGLQAFFAATTQGASEPALTTGALVLKGDTLRAGATTSNIQLPLFTAPLDVSLSADGPVSDLRLSAVLAGTGPLELSEPLLWEGSVLGLSGPLDLRGVASARLQGGALTQARADLGPLHLEGEVTLSPPAADLHVSVDPIQLGLSQQEDGPAGPVRGTVSLPAGALNYSASGLEVTGTAAVQNPEAGPFMFELNELDLSLLGFTAASGSAPDVPGSWTFTASGADDRLTFHAGSEQYPFTLNFAELPVRFSADAAPALMSGALTPEPDSPGEFRAQLDLTPGSSLGGLALVNGADLGGTLATTDGTVGLSGTIGSLPASVHIDWSTQNTTVAGVLGELAYQYDLTTGAWELGGDAPIGPLLAELGAASVDADFAGTLNYDTAGYWGNATIGVAGALPLTVTFTGEGEQLTVDVRGEVGGLPIEGSGAVAAPLPEAVMAAVSAPPGEGPALHVDAGPFHGLTLDARGLRGAGELQFGAPATVTLPAVPWALALDWQGASGYVEAAGGERLELALQGGTLQARGSLNVPFTYAGNGYTLRAAPGPRGADAARGTDVGDFPINAELKKDGEEVPLLSLHGTPAALKVEGALRLSDLFAQLPENIRPDGTLSVTASGSVMGEPSYAGELELRGPAPSAEGEIHANFAGRGTDFQLDVSGLGLSLQHLPASQGETGGQLTLSANAVDIGSYLPAGASGQLDGSLSYASGTYSGFMHANLSAPEGSLPLTAQVTLTGEGAGLTADAAVESDAFALSASGPLLPAPELAGQLSALGGAVTGTFTFEEQLHATLTSSEQQFFDHVYLPAQSAQLHYDPASGTGGLKGPSIDLALRGGDLSGSFSLPLHISGETPALVQLTGAAAGPLLDPELTAELSLQDTAGRAFAAVSGSLKGGATLAATLTPGELQALLPDALAVLPGALDGEATVAASADADLNWLASVELPTALLGTGAELALQATGTGANYEGTVTLRTPDEVATASFAGSGAALTGNLDLGEVAWGLLGEQAGVPLEVTGGGQLELTTAPFTWHLHSDLTGTVSDHALTLSGNAPGALALSLAGPNADLTGELEWGPTLLKGGNASLSGSLYGQAVEADFTLEEALKSATLTVEAGEARLVAHLLSGDAQAAGDPPSRQRVEVSAIAPAGSLAPLGGNATATISLADGAAYLAGLNLTLQGSGAADTAALTLAGPLTPSTALSGSLTTSSLSDPVSVQVVTGEGVSAHLGWHELTLSATATTTDLREGALTLAGTADAAELNELLTVLDALLPASSSEGLRAAVQELTPHLEAADLTYQASSGWSGGLTAHSALPWLLGSDGAHLVASAAEGVLQLNLSAHVPDGAATLEVEVPARPWGNEATNALTGALRVDLPGSALMDMGSAPLRVGVDAAVAGQLLAPTLSGTTSLAGAAVAAGEVTYGPGGLHVTLEGPAISAHAAVNGQAPTIEVHVRDLPAGDWLPQAPSSDVSFSARWTGSGLSVSDLIFRAGSSTVTGGATLRLAQGGDQAGPTLSAALDTDLDLSDLDLGTALLGRVRGPLIIDSAQLADMSTANLIANLVALNVTTPTLGGSVSGNLTIGGNLADPRVSAQLHGDGAIHGSLRVDARPQAQHYLLSSTLGFGQVVTDLRVDLTEATAHASGTVRVGESVLLIRDDPAAPGPGGNGADLLITGAGGFAGLTGRVASDLSSAVLTADLAGLHDSVAGLLRVEVRSRPVTTDGATADYAWLRGHAEGVAIAGVQLGELELHSSEIGAPLTVAGAALNATLDPLTLQWQLLIGELALTAGSEPLLASLKAEGQGLSADVTGTLFGPEVALAIAGSINGDVNLALTGTAYGGVLDVTGSRSGTSRAWDGGGTYAGGQLAGLTLNAEATLLGVDLLPQVVMSTRATADGGEQPFQVSGTASFGPGGLTLDQLAQGGPLDEGLRVQGRLMPEGDLTLSSLKLTPGVSLTPATAEAATTSQVRLAPLATPGGRTTHRLTATGGLELEVGPLKVELSATPQAPLGPPTGELLGDLSATPTGAPRLKVSLLGVPALAASADLSAADFPDLLARISSGSVIVYGEEGITGRVSLHPARATAELHDVTLALPGVSAGLSGTLGPAHTNLRGSLTLDADLPALERVEAYTFPLYVSGDDSRWEFSSVGPHGELTAIYDASVTGTPALTLEADLTLNEGSVAGKLSLESGSLVGTLSASDVRLYTPATGPVTLGWDTTVADGRVGGTAAVGTDAGRLTLNGSWGLKGLLPDAIAGTAEAGGRIEARLRSFDVAQLPVVQERLPGLSGEITGSAQLRNSFLIGQLFSPELDVGGQGSPLEVTFNGPLSELNFELKAVGAVGRATLAGDNLAGVFRFERFPLTLLSTAVVGPSDFTADLTGVMRFDGSFSDPAAGYLRLATEEVRLERLGIVTTGNTTVTFEERSLNFEKAEFVGSGEWSAQGVLKPDLFDFQLHAVDADFTPLLGLIPHLARLGVGANGSFDLSVAGDATLPRVSLTSEKLDVEVAGGQYELEGAALNLTGATLTVGGRVNGLSPLAGALDVTGGAHIMLLPFELSDTNLALKGNVEAPGFGEIRHVEGQLRQAEDGAPALTLNGTLGAGPVEVSGTLSPLDLTARGQGVTLAFPGLLVERALVDTDITLTAVEGGVALGGSVHAEEVVIDPAVRGSAIPEQATPSTPTNTQPGGGGLNALLFDALSIRAPGRVTLTTTVGAFEAGMDLTLTGSGAEPRLGGTAHAVRGSLRFGGRDFTIDSALATFTPNRGVYPELDVTAHADLEKSRVISAAPGVKFVMPRAGSTFQVRLAFQGPVEAAPGGGINFDVDPLLTSDALIEVENEQFTGSATRPFTEAELMSLVTLGRSELSADLIGSGGLGEAVAQGALDTAVDLFVVSGLEGALREALGLDVVEIRTTAISTLLDESGQPFGVSLRLGGYLNPELFASYRIGTPDDRDPEFSVTNEVQLRYALGPVDLDLTGRIDLPTAGTQATPRPELGASLGYQLNEFTSLDLGVTMSLERSKLEFGVRLTW